MNPIKQFIAKTFGLVTQEEIQDFVRLSGIPQKERPLQRATFMLGQGIPPEMKIEEYLKAYKGWVFACVRVIAEETADIKLRLYRRIDQTEFDIVDNHPALDLLYKVNPLYTSYLLWEATAAYMELTGEAFWWLVGPKNNPTEIWILRPDWVQVVDSKDKLISGYTYGPTGDKRMFIPFEEIIHFKDFHPLNVHRGFGTVRGSAKSIDEDEFQKDYSRQFFHNSALPGGALKTESNLTDEQRERMRQEWEFVHRGGKKSWKIAVLEAGLEWQDIGMNRRDMDYIEGRRLTRDEILAEFRVPKPLLTFDDVNRAAAKEARAILLENVISHKMKRHVSFLNEFYLPRYGDDTLFFDYENPVPNDEAMKLEYYRNALGGAAWMTINEVREAENKEPIEGGDSLRIPFSLQDIGTIDQQAKDAQKKRKLYTFNVRIPPYGFLKSQIGKIAQRIEQKTQKLLTAMIAQKKVINNPSTVNVDKDTKAVEAEVVDEREARWRTIVSRTDPREIRYLHVLSSLFSEQQQRVNDQIATGLERALKAKRAVRATVNDITDVVKDNDIFTGPLMDIARNIIEAEGIQQIQSLVDNGVFFMQTQEIQRFIKRDGVKYISAINAETADQLKNELSQAIEKQESIPQIKARVEKVYDAARGYRATRIARSEVLRATNFATEQAYKQSKVVNKKEWLTAHDERVCPWCGPMDGKQLDLSGSFADKGDVLTGTNPKGSKVKLTIGIEDVKYPPLHPNCRCTLIPVLSGDETVQDFSFQKTHDAFNWDGYEDVDQKTLEQSVAHRYDSTFPDLAGFTKEFKWEIQRLKMEDVSVHAAAEQDKVEQYKAAILNGAKFPPLSAVNLPGTFVNEIIDGAHRIEALKELGATEMQVLIGKPK